MSSAAMPSKKYALLNTCCTLTFEIYHQLIPTKGGGLPQKENLRRKKTSYGHQVFFIS